LGGTYALGPCIGFIIDVIYDEKKVCILDHYSFLDVDESKLPLSKQIQWFLEYVLKALRNFLIIDSAANIFEKKLGNIFVFVTGGDEKEGASLRNICCIINANQLDVVNDIFDDHHILFLYKSLKNKIILMKPVSSMLSDDDEEHG
jgi:hypothetical protein